MGNSFPCGGFPLNMEPGRANGTENSCSHNFLVVSSAVLSLEPSDLSFTESSCLRTKPRIAWRSAWYSCGWTCTVACRQFGINKTCLIWPGVRAKSDQYRSRGQEMSWGSSSSGRDTSCTSSRCPRGTLGRSSAAVKPSTDFRSQLRKGEFHLTLLYFGFTSR